MLKAIYTADAGSIRIKIGEQAVTFSNQDGDGDYKCYLMTEQEHMEYQKQHQEKFGIPTHEYHTLGTIVGPASVMEYDCEPRTEEAKRNWLCTSVLFDLEAGKRYYVERRNNTFYFVEWKNE